MKIAQRQLTAFGEPPGAQVSPQPCAAPGPNIILRDAAGLMWGKERYAGKVGAKCGRGDGAAAGTAPAPRAAGLEGRVVLFPPSRLRRV